MFHIEDSDVYLTSSNADGMCEDQDVGDVLCKEEPALSPLTMYLKNIPESKVRICKYIFSFSDLNIGTVYVSFSSMYLDFSSTKRMMWDHILKRKIYKFYID